MDALKDMSSKRIAINRDLLDVLSTKKRILNENLQSRIR